MKRSLLSILLIATLLIPIGAAQRPPTALAEKEQPVQPASPAAKPRYTVTDLGTLGGASEAFAISNNGQVAGKYLAGNNYLAFFWNDGVMQGLGTLGGSSSEAHGVNDAGQVVGYSLTGNGRNHAFLWQNGAMQDLGTFPGGSVSLATGINNAGQVVGHSDNAAYKLHAFVWNGSMGDLGTLGGDHSYGYGINDNGQAVGASHLAAYPDLTTHAFRWSGGMQDLGTLGWAHSLAYGINDNGDVVGRLVNQNMDGWHAFVSQGGGMQDLGGTYATALDINNKGLIVGEDGSQPNQNAMLAMLWEGGQMKNLNSLIDPGSGWVLQSASAINERGQIVGKGSFNGQMRAFLLKPNAYHWANSAGGAWHLATNWDPQGDPGAGDTVVFDLTGQYSVDVSTLASSNRGLAPNAFSIDRMIIASTNFVYLNNMDLNMVYDQPEDPSLQVNDGGTAAVNSGAATFSHAVIGGAPPANPSNPPLARLQVLGNNTSLTGSGRLTVGEDGMGELFVTDGGQLTSAESRLGGLMEGVADVGGNGTIWQTGNIAVGYQVTGTLEIKLGGLVDSDSAYVAFGGASEDSRVEVDGVSPVTGQASMWALLGDLIIGQGAAGQVDVENGGDLYVNQNVQILNGFLWVEGRTPNNDLSDLDVLGTVFVGGANNPMLMIKSAARGDIEGNLMIGANGVGLMQMSSTPAQSTQTTLYVIDPLAGLCAIGREFNGYVTIDEYSLLHCRDIQLGGQAGASGTGFVTVEGGILRALEVLRVGQAGGGAGRLEMVDALVATEGTYIAPNGVIAGTGKLVVGSLGLIIEGIMSPGINVQYPLA